MSKLNQIIKTVALRMYGETGIKPECERCFYVSDSKCPDFPHICALTIGLKNTEEKEWIEENIPEKILMRAEYQRSKGSPTK